MNGPVLVQSIAEQACLVPQQHIYNPPPQFEENVTLSRTYSSAPWDNVPVSETQEQLTSARMYCVEPLDSVPVSNALENKELSSINMSIPEAQASESIAHIPQDSGHRNQLYANEYDLEQQQCNEPTLIPTTSEIKPDSTSEEGPRVPISHLMSGHQYPSLVSVPSNIAQSFAPIFVQPQNQQSGSSDIYSDYVQNPYNLTLPNQKGYTDESETLSPTSEPADGGSVAGSFQLSSYFNTDTLNIPPGSEILFGGP